ncbi:MAG: CBS domain-containing protein [Paracoccaceae bacterium]|nr:CBS domain-containing protein [Paracoccaceae bacterium]MDH5530459.1 CBS domain-containing protein [Paracoccaceae bacterium]
MTDRPKIADYMARNLVMLTPGMEINRALHLLLGHRISGAPVIDDSAQLVGVLSKKDCLRAALNASYYQDWGDTVANYMSTDVQTLEADLDIVAAAETFLQSAYRRFPVTQEGRLVGQISRADVLRALAEHWG